jgi:hypothetical protein
MNMKTNAGSVGCLCAPVKSFVGYGHLSVHAEQGSDHIVVFYAVFGKTDIFFYACLRYFFPVTVRYFITEIAAYSEQFRCFCNFKKAVCCCKGACVMIDYRSNTAAYRIDHWRHAAVKNIVKSQLFVQPPPKTG